MKPFSQACENNKEAILDLLKVELVTAEVVLEIGSGTGQHASYFAPALPHLQWQPSDRAANLPAISAWVEDAATPNILPLLELDVGMERWPLAIPDTVFTANTLHIMGWQLVRRLYAYLGEHSSSPGCLIVYGPFNYDGNYTSDSNACFDLWLKEQNPVSAIRDFEAVDELARKAGYRLSRDHAMPANNRLLVWRK
ncbi:MAG: hypothetical protein ACI9GW_002811 [Halieaceae bacterium]|jgi:hypothetical protein